MSFVAELGRPSEKMPVGPGTWTLIDQYLHEQQQLTAVGRFAQWHDEAAPPAHEKYYHALIPATPPGEGEQYAFEVDLDACSGCKACVSACNALNGLDENETWRDVGFLHGGTEQAPFLQHVTAACHHCVDPACLHGCPVRAYEKDPRTGIVRHLDDQCIGCQYCALACPYDVPKYNKSRGIVRKCDLCSQRLAVNEAPACAQSCPNSAIRVTVVRTAEAIENSEAGQFLPGAPDPRYTVPTTVYKTKKVFPRNVLPADYYSVRPEHAHWPLVVMLVLTQLSVGAFGVELLMRAFGAETAARGVQSLGALLFGLLALGASTLHLGRPLYAFRAVIGLKTSWLSREILAFGMFAGLATAYAAAVWFGGTSPVLRMAQPWLGGAVVLTGLAGVFCSVMIYQCTRRSFWNGTATTFKFGSTMVVLGLATALWTSSIANASWPTLPASAADAGNIGHGVRWLIVASVIKLLFEATTFLHLRDRQVTPLKRSALLMTGDLARVTQVRFALGILGGVLLPAVVLLATSKAPLSGEASSPSLVVVSLLFAALVVAELAERYLFFTAVVAPKMPGGLRT
jgi:formate dehydrogenase iron-sulfur subunit